MLKLKYVKTKTLVNSFHILCLFERRWFRVVGGEAPAALWIGHDEYIVYTYSIFWYYARFKLQSIIPK